MSGNWKKFVLLLDSPHALSSRAIGIEVATARWEQSDGQCGMRMEQRSQTEEGRLEMGQWS